MQYYIEECHLLKDFYVLTRKSNAKNINLLNKVNILTTIKSTNIVYKFYFEIKYHIQTGPFTSAYIPQWDKLRTK